MRIDPDATLLQAAAHELKNGAAALEEALALLAEGLACRSAYHDELSRSACDAARLRAAALRRRLVALTLLMAAPGPTDLRIETMHADELLDELLAGALTGPRPDLRVERATTGEDAPIDCDAARLLLVLEGALDNARRHARRRIEVGALRADGGVLLRVDDDGAGPGAPPVEPGPPHATGLGLRLAATIAGAHRRHGRAGWARLSARPGGGGRFEIWLP